MKKEIILVAFPNFEKGRYYIEDNVLPLVKDLKRSSNNSYTTDKYELRIVSLQNTNTIRGLSPSLVFLSEECAIDSYNFILDLVRGDHRKIKVVI